MLVVAVCIFVWWKAVKDEREKAQEKDQQDEAKSVEEQNGEPSVAEAQPKQLEKVV